MGWGAKLRGGLPLVSVPCLRLSERADSMNRAVATGDINSVVLHGKTQDSCTLHACEHASAMSCSMVNRLGANSESGP